ncbi:BTB and MATH domain-containing protein 42 [Caerostris extrusa]|uniref:BTB and MATH domain-containing protein 42 n=1 Tax=Caerostris extrusa TaxID=172846 RepID=A0AAV4QPV7_CAEEX|nr:BTB and MATH domain-containing protein 42 [Caerostris extrusa]
MWDFAFIWKIEDYNFLPLQRGEVLKSPSFNIHLVGTAFLELYPKGKESYDGIGINVGNSNNLSAARIFCDLKLINGEKETQLKKATDELPSYTSWRFNRNTEPFGIEAKDLNVFKKETLIVTCYFSTRECDWEGFTKTHPNDKDIAILSEDMEKMYNNDQFYDLILCSPTEKFLLNRAILYARIPELLDEWIANQNQSKFDDKSLREICTNIDASVLKILLPYVYSGKLDVCSSDIPSSLCTIADSYKLVDLKQKLCSYPKKVVTRTCVKTSKTLFTLFIENLKILDSKKIYSPSFRGGIIKDSDLKIVCFLNKDSTGKETLDFCFRRLCTAKHSPMYIKCQITVTEHFSYNKVSEYVFISDEEWYFPSFVPVIRINDDILLNTGIYSHLGKHGVNLRFEFYISGGETSFIEETEFDSCQRVFNQDKDTKKLAEDIAYLYNIFLPKFSDVELIIGDVRFPAHKVILAARSPVFARMFTNDMLEKQNGIVHIKDVDVASLNMMLVYMYSAKITILNYDCAVKLYSVADKYEVISLKEQCSSFLKCDLSSNNACDILVLADMHGDISLKEFVKDFICAHSSIILEMPEWKNLIDSRTDLVSEVLRSLMTIVLDHNKTCGNADALMKLKL